MPEKASSKPTAKASQSKPGAKAKTVLDRKASSGWLTSDEDEISLRRWRGRTEGIEVVAMEPQYGFFGAFRARSASGGQYEVEIRSLEERLNSCGCIDHRVNGLGTCKHIEGVLGALRRQNPRAFREAAACGSDRVEIFLDRRENATVRVSRPAGSAKASAEAREFLARFASPTPRRSPITMRFPRWSWRGRMRPPGYAGPCASPRISHPGSIG